MKTPKFKAVKGMQDVFPEEAARWVKLESLARAISGLYGYGEIRIPLLESTELFTRSIGETTDIVEKEMFTFTDAGKQSVTLRPEGTAGVVRAYLQQAIYNRQVLAKYFYLGPMFRRERPQAGRRRQFNQFGSEALGSNNPALDAEAIDLLICYFEAAGLKEYQLAINSVGCSRCRPAYQKELQIYFTSRRALLCADCRRRLEKNVFRILDCKNPQCREVVASAPVLIEFLCPECESDFQSVKTCLSELALPFAVNPFLVRGLDYYTKTTFEIYSDRLGAQDAVAAGGRYDNLIEELGGPSRGAVGFSVGLERLLLCLSGGAAASLPPPERSVYCVNLDREAFRLNFVLLSALRKKGIKGEIDYLDRSLKAQMREANRMGVDYALIRGAEEMKKGVVKVKEMKSGEEKAIAEKEVLGYIKTMTNQ